MKRTSRSSRLVRIAARSPVARWPGPDVVWMFTPSSRATMLASVVLPRPGGPYSRMWSAASSLARAASSRMRRFSLTVVWPMYSASRRGRRLVSTAVSSTSSGAGVTSREPSSIAGESSRYWRQSNACSSCCGWGVANPWVGGGGGGWGWWVGGAGRRVFDLASGSGLCAIAALKAGAAEATGADIDPFAVAVMPLNARANGCRISVVRRDVLDESRRRGRDPGRRLLVRVGRAERVCRGCAGRATAASTSWSATLAAATCPPTTWSSWPRTRSARRPSWRTWSASRPGCMRCGRPPGRPSVPAQLPQRGLDALLQRGAHRHGPRSRRATRRVPRPRSSPAPGARPRPRTCRRARPRRPTSRPRPPSPSAPARSAPASRLPTPLTAVSTASSPWRMASWRSVTGRELRIARPTLGPTPVTVISSSKKPSSSTVRKPYSAWRSSRTRWWVYSLSDSPERAIESVDGPQKTR